MTPWSLCLLVCKMGTTQSAPQDAGEELRPPKPRRKTGTERALSLPVPGFQNPSPGGSLPRAQRKEVGLPLTRQLWQPGPKPPTVAVLLSARWALMDSLHPARRVAASEGWAAAQEAGGARPRARGQQASPGSARKPEVAAQVANAGQGDLV